MWVVKIFSVCSFSKKGEGISLSYVKQEYVYFRFYWSRNSLACILVRSNVVPNSRKNDLSNLLQWNPSCPHHHSQGSREFQQYWKCQKQYCTKECARFRTALQPLNVYFHIITNNVHEESSCKFRNFYSSIHNSMPKMVHMFQEKITRGHQIQLQVYTQRNGLLHSYTGNMLSISGCLPVIYFPNICVVHLSGLQNCQNYRVCCPKNPKKIQKMNYIAKVHGLMCRAQQ